MPFFSIIISIYNISSWIKKNLNLILNQDFSNYEILLIDDGSTDDSAIICKNLERIYPNLKFIQQINQGLGSARNTGIKNAKGEYICFFDLDDCIKENWLTNIHSIIKDTCPDVLLYSYREINLKYNTSTELIFQNKILTSPEDIKDHYVELLSGLHFNNGFAWNKVYKRDLLIKNNILFPSLRIQQDEVFNHEVYKHANSIVTSSEVLYDYYIYDKGNNRNSFIVNRMKIFEKVKDSFEGIAQYWNLNNWDFKFYIHSRFVRNCLNNRNPIDIENTNAFRKQLFLNEALNKSAVFLIENSKGLSTTEKLYIKSIIKKSKSLFLISEFISVFNFKMREIYHRFIRLLSSSKNINR